MKNLLSTGIIICGLLSLSSNMAIAAVKSPANQTQGGSKSTMGSDNKAPAPAFSSGSSKGY